MAMGAPGGRPRLQPGLTSASQASYDERIVFMRASALFANISPGECAEILSCARVRTFARNEMLFLQGEPVNNLLLIQTGSVKLTQISSDGNEAILWISGSGDVVGVHAEIVGSNHTCSARAMEQCKTIVWEFKRLQLLGTQYPEITENLARMLNRSLQDLEERFCEIATENAAKRLALGFLRLMKSVGKVRKDGLEVGLMREELAQMTGTTPFTISRILAKWSDQGVVILHRQSIVIPDADRLRLVADQES